MNNEIELRVNQKYVNIIDKDGNVYGTYTINVINVFKNPPKGADSVIKLRLIKQGRSEEITDDDEGFSLFDSNWFKK